MRGGGHAPRSLVSRWLLRNRCRRGEQPPVELCRPHTVVAFRLGCQGQRSLPASCRLCSVVSRSVLLKTSLLRGELFRNRFFQLFSKCPETQGFFLHFSSGWPPLGGPQAFPSLANFSPTGKADFFCGPPGSLPGRSCRSRRRACGVRRRTCGACGGSPRADGPGKVAAPACPRSEARREKTRPPGWRGPRCFVAGSSGVLAFPALRARGLAGQQRRGACGVSVDA